MAGFLQRLFGGSEEDSNSPPASVVIVSGLPRSGTSMMMKMLETGGLEVFVDGIRTADDDNPKGYYEFERVKQLDKGDTAWVAEARGKVVKVISALLEYLPPENEYKVIFMRRDYGEVLRSQQKMMDRREEENTISDDAMADLFDKHLQQVDAWLSQQENFHVLSVDYNAMLIDPTPDVARIVDFLPQPLDSDAMAAVVDPTLYRNRG